MSEKVKSKSNGNLLKILILVMFILILIGGAVFGTYYFATKNSPKSANAVKEVIPVEEAFYPAGDFLVNLADENSKRYIKAKIVLAYDSKNEKLPDELTTRADVLRDSIISVLSSKKAEEMTPKGREDLKKEIVIRVNSVIIKGKLTNVYYNDFLVQ